MYSIKVDYIIDGFAAGNTTPWDGAIDSIQKHGGVILETPLGEKVLIKSDAALKKFFNVQ